MVLGTWGFYKSTPVNSIERILEEALSSGVLDYDTALVYGEQAAEKQLGILRMSNPFSKLHVTTKIPGKIKPYKNCRMDEIYDIDWMRRCLEQSLDNLGKIETLLLHNWSPDFGEKDCEAVLEILENFKKEKLCEEIGISLPNNFNVMPQKIAIDMCDAFMIPYNNNNLWGKRICEKLQFLEKRVMLRSIFGGKISGPISHKDIKEKIINASFVDELVIGTTNLLHMNELLQILKEV